MRAAASGKEVEGGSKTIINVAAVEGPVVRRHQFMHGHNIVIQQTKPKLNRRCDVDSILPKFSISNVECRRRNVQNRRFDVQAATIFVVDCEKEIEILPTSQKYRQDNDIK